MKAVTVSRNVSLGVLLVAVAVILQFELPLRWLLVVLCAMSLVNAVLKKRWRWAPHPLVWGAGLSFAFAREDVGGWAAFWGLLGLSVILACLIGLVPRRPEPAPPRRPGEGIVLDVEATSGGTED